MDRRNYRQLVDTTVEIANKVGVADMVGRIVEDLKDESEPYRRMVMETIKKVVAKLGVVSTMISGICYLMSPLGLCCETTRFYSPHQEQVDTSKMGESIEAARESKDKHFHGLLEVACLGLQVR